VLNGSASKIGIGQGLGGSLCSAFRADTFADPIDYLVGADLTQPLSPGNALTLALFAERQSEPNVYQRAAVGGRVGFNRRLSERAFLRVGADVERGSTLASDVLFCGAFQVCDPDAIARLTGARFRNTIGATVTRDATNQPIDQSTGHVERTGLTWAPPWLLSDVTFVRWNGEVAAYRELQAGWVGAVSLRLGNFFQTASPDREDDFLPPEDRFYAGGATTVRGYDRNALGPGLYVTDEVDVDSAGRPVIDVDTGEKIPVPGAARFSASGGTALMLFNLELRMPSPVFSRYLRLATFVDAGSVTTEQLWQTSLDEVKITPGFGLRLQTPVGPVRVDVAYNPNGPPVAPLYFADPETGVLTRILDDFQQEPGSFLGRFRIHLAVGQAF
jgi:outer membrane protein insertion porin family